MNRQRFFTLCAAVSMAVFPCVAAADDGTTGSGSNLYLSGTVTWSQDHRYDSWGPATTLSVGTGAGAGQLHVQNGARVDVANALFIGGKGYASPYSIEEGKDGLVTVGAGSVLSAGGQSPAASGAHIYVGWSSGAKGRVLLDGGELISNYMLHVGSFEGTDGLLEVRNGGRVSLRLGETISDAEACFLSIATVPSSKGVLRVSGGSALAFEVPPGKQSLANIGTGGDGTLLVEDGSRVSLGQDFAQVGVDAGSRGLIHVSGGAVLELPDKTYMGRYAGSQGSLVVEGSGTRVQAEELWVGVEGNASLALHDGSRTEVGSFMYVGMKEGAGVVRVSQGAALRNTAASLVGSRGAVQLEEGGQWQTTAPVAVAAGGVVSLRGASRWEAQDDADFLPGSTLSFQVESLERLPEVSVAPGKVLTMGDGSRVVVTLSPSLLNKALQLVELPLIEGQVAGENFSYELQDETGLFDSSGLELLSNGKLGLSISLDREAVRRTLSSGAARLANGLWSSTWAVNDYASALLARSSYANCRRFWVMGLGSFSRMQSQGSTPGFDYQGGGYALGADACLDESSSLGVSLGQIYGSNKSSDGFARIRQNSLMASLYGRYYSDPREGGRRMVLDAYAAYGRVHNHARSALYNNASVWGTGHWWDDVFALGVRASWEMALTEESTLLPFIGLRYVHGKHGSFSLSAQEDSRAYSSSSLHNVSIPVGFTLRSQVALWGGRLLQPELTLAYVRDVSRNNPHVASRMLGEHVYARGVAPRRHALMLRAGASMEFNEHWSAGVYYHLERRSHDVEQAVNASVSYGF